MKPETTNTLQDKIRGSLIGGAAGDALGYAVEFMSYNNIVQKYGEKGITRYELNAKGVAEISDDTQMTLYTANGLLNAISKYPVKELGGECAFIQDAYVEWYKTQTMNSFPIHGSQCWVSEVPEMYARRAPGNTCMNALFQISKGRIASNDSKGCGGIMRVAPVAHYGVSMGLDKERMMVLACSVAQITHKHPLGWMPAGLLVYVLQTILETEDVGLHTVVNAALQSVKTLGCHFGMFDSAMKELSRGTSQAIMLAASPTPDTEAISQLGEGWTGEEAWYIALFCMLRHFKDFEAAIIAAVNHNGDSDSTGAICGNLIGAIHGYDALPEHFKQKLELHDVILNMADDLHNGQITYNV